MKKENIILTLIFKLNEIHYKKIKFHETEYDKWKDKVYTADLISFNSEKIRDNKIKKIEDIDLLTNYVRGEKPVKLLLNLVLFSEKYLDKKENLKFLETEFNNLENNEVLNDKKFEKVYEEFKKFKKI